MLDKYKHEVFRLVVETPNANVNDKPTITAYCGDKEIDPADLQILLDAGLLLVQKTETRYWLNDEGRVIWREKQRRTEIARLENQLARLKGDKP